MQGSDAPAGTPGRAMTLILIAVIAMAFLGYFVGLDYGVPYPEIESEESLTAHDASPDDASALPALSYVDIRQQRIGPTRQRVSSVASLRNQREIPLEGFVPDPEAKRASLALRAERRAYNGAPPIIPHDVEQLSNASCLTCHGAGFQLENRTAKQLPHPYLANCMQCHAPNAPTVLTGQPLAANLFDGVKAPWEGERAWPGAPPVVPHTTWMRDNCLACHGPTGWPGMETTHPWRENCMQCHAPSSRLELHPFSPRPEFLPAPQTLRAPTDSTER